MFEWQLTWIEFIQQMRTPVWDGVFRFLNLFDTTEFTFVLIPTLWLIRGWKVGFRLFVVLFLNTLINEFCKDLFCLPRPFHLDPVLAVIRVSGYGLPSGAAQTVVVLSGLLVRAWQSRWKWVVALIYSALISFSRLYLGVHFPVDLVAGWAIGFALLAGVVYAGPLLEKWLERRSPRELFLMGQGVAASVFLWASSAGSLAIAASAMGVGVGLFLNFLLKWEVAPAPSLKEGFFRAFVGVAGLFLLNGVLAPLHLCMRCALLGFWVSSGCWGLLRALKGGAFLEKGNL